MKNKFILIFILLIQGISYGQFKPKQLFDYDISVEPDSLFEKFELPKLPKFKESILTNDGRNGVYFLCDIFSDTTNKVKDIKVSPLIGIGNNMSKNDPLWDKCIKIIIKSSKSWVFKPFSYNIPVGTPQNERKELTLINEGKTTPLRRPLGGQQHHMIILKYEISFWHSSPHLIYMMNVGLQLPE